MRNWGKGGDSQASTESVVYGLRSVWSMPGTFWAWEREKGMQIWT